MTEALSALATAAIYLLIFVGLGAFLLERIAARRQARAEERWEAEPVHHRDWPISSTPIDKTGRS